MSEKEYKIKCENLFKKNTILLNQQQIDAEHIRALQKQNGELTDKVKELEAQIEKMKSCRSCKHDNHCNHRVCDKSLPFWELRR
ncbi:MAG: hypothetical protein J6S67_07325 [Methanobrevibacter sp.]|nr:hypothetical protein [Methanobrevibacter sp.]